MKSQSTMIRVLIADDHSIVRQGLATIINRDPEMTVIATVEDGQQAINCLSEYKPDVTLMDLRAAASRRGANPLVLFVLNLNRPGLSRHCYCLNYR